MNDALVEWITTIGEKAAHKFARFAFLVLAILFFISTLITGIWLLLVVMVLCIILCVIMWYRAYLEYSFILVGDDMRIAVVYNLKRRKLKIEFSLNNVERMVHRVEDYDNPTFLCDPGSEGDKYSLVYHDKDERNTIILEDPDPEFLKIMQRRRILV